MNTARGPGHPGKIPGTSRIPLFETQGRQSFEGGHEVFGHHPFAWKTPTPPGGLRTQKLNLCALFSCLSFGAGFEIAPEPSKLQKEGENPGKGGFYFLRQTLVRTKPWFKRDLRPAQPKAEPELPEAFARN